MHISLCFHCVGSSYIPRFAVPGIWHDGRPDNAVEVVSDTTNVYISWTDSFQKGMDVSIAEIITITPQLHVHESCVRTFWSF